jgi:hypothetical protein
MVQNINVYIGHMAGAQDEYGKVVAYLNPKCRTRDAVYARMLGLQEVLADLKKGSLILDDMWKKIAPKLPRR